MATFERASRPRSNSFASTMRVMTISDLPALGIAAGRAAGHARASQREFHLGLDLRALPGRRERRGADRQCLPEHHASRCGCRCGAASRRCPTSATFRSSRGDRDASRMRSATALGIPRRSTRRPHVVRRLRPRGPERGCVSLDAGLSRAAAGNDRRERDVRPRLPLRRSRPRRRCRRDEAGIRNHFRMHRQRHRAALHLAR